MACTRILCLLASLTILSVSTVAWSAEFHGRSSTQFLWFDNIFTHENQAEVAQHLRFSLTKLDKDNKFSLNGYGRISQDVWNDDGFNTRLFYLYAEYRDLFDKVDIRAGRQFVNYAAGAALIDGGMIDLKNIGPIAFSVMGGRHVVYGIDKELTKSGDAVFGASAYLVGYPRTDLELSYYLQFDRDGVAREQLGAMFKQYLFSGLKLYGNARYETASESLTELLVGAKYFASQSLVISAEYFNNYPTFDYTSIYSIFAVNKYNEGSIRADYTINDMFAIRGAYKRQDFGDDTDGDVFEAGVKIRPMRNLLIDLAYDRRQGYAGDLNGGTLDIQYDMTPMMQLAGGLAYDVYQKDRMTGDTDTQSYWAGARYKLDKTMSFDGRIQYSVNTKLDDDWQSRIAFNYDF